MVSAEEWQSKLNTVYQQTKDIKRNPNKNTRCSCGHYITPLNSYRCLYCSEIYCKECAEIHFGKSVDEWRRDNPVQGDE